MKKVALGLLSIIKIGDSSIITLSCYSMRTCVGPRLFLPQEPWGIGTPLKSE